jgi:hypothetical protein
MGSTPSSEEFTKNKRLQRKGYTKGKERSEIKKFAHCPDQK